MKKMLLILAVLLLLILPSLALAESVAAEPVRLDNSTIICGDKVYYSGSIDGGESGVYVMNADGSGAQRISDLSADLLALSEGNLLVYQYDLDTGDAALGVLLPDGALVPLGHDYPGAAVAANGRFYWGPASCASDGSDVQTYFISDDYYNYYALTVEGDYLYYLDWSEMSSTAYSEGSLQPMGAALCRMNLTDQSSEVISGVGTRFLGLEDDLIYYTRDNFWRETEDGSEEVAVDQGLFCATVDTLSETRLADYSADGSIVDSYTLVKDGIIYGMHSDYSTDSGSTSIIRLKNDGTRLPDFPVDNESYVALSCVEGDLLYLTQCTFISSEDDFIQQDRILTIDLADGSETVLTTDSLDMLFYSELDPSVKVVGSRIYFAPYDMERWSICLKSMNLDGSDLRLLAHGISFAEG